MQSSLFISWLQSTADVPRCLQFRHQHPQSCLGQQDLPGEEIFLRLWWAVWWRVMTMALSPAPCSNWPESGLPHGQLRAGLSPKAATFSVCRLCTPVETCIYAWVEFFGATLKKNRKYNCLRENRYMVMTKPRIWQVEWWNDKHLLLSEAFRMTVEK